MLTIGKAIGGGVPCGALGLADDVVTQMFEQAEADYEDTGGVGGTLAGNQLSSAAMRATLEHVLTTEAFERMIPLAARFAERRSGRDRPARDAVERHAARLPR